MDRNAPPPPKPVIDDELAAMEAGNQNAAEASILNRISATVRRGTVRRGNRQPTEHAGRDRRRDAGQDRRIRRAMARDGVDPNPRKTPHGRLGRAKPAKSVMQKQIEYKQAVRRELSRIKLFRLKPECPEIKWILGVPELKTAWQLANATTEFVQSIPGFGPARRKKVHSYLKSKNVPVTWEP